MQTKGDLSIVCDSKELLVRVVLDLLSTEVYKWTPSCFMHVYGIVGTLTVELTAPFSMTCSNLLQHLVPSVVWMPLSPSQSPALIL